MTGACLKGCVDGFSGETCTEVRANTSEEDSKKINFILIGIGTFILILILVILIFCSKRKFAEKKKTIINKCRERSKIDRIAERR